MSGIDWVQQPAVLLLLAIALIVQADAVHQLMNSLDIAWAVAWWLLPTVVVVGLVFRGLRVVLSTVLVYWCRLPSPRAVPLLRLRRAVATAAPKCAGTRRARDSIP